MNNQNDHRQALHDDDISLVDIARVLLRRKYWIIGTFVVCMLGTLAFALKQERKYSYTTSILIGEFGLDKYVANAKNTTNVLEKRLLPVIRRDFVDANDLEGVPFGTSVTADEGNNFVNLQSDAPERLQQTVRDFHSKLAAALTEDHSEKLTLLERESDVRLRNLKAALESEQRQLEKYEEFLADASKVTGEAVQSGAVDARAQSSSEGMQASLSSSNNALTLLLGQMQLTEQISKRQSRINELQGQIESEELKRSWIKPTRVNNLATASISPTGTSKALILILGAVLGGMLGLFIAFIVEFWGAVQGENDNS
jgi:uncharacterized protein involved in exopolysaccharide biosynthesis